MKMYVTTEEDKIVLHNTANYPYENIALTHDELEQLAAYYQREKDEKEMAEYLQSAIDIPDSAEISATLAQKYLKDAGLFDQLVTETNRLQDDLGYDFLTSVGKASEKLEKDRDVKEWYGITRSIAERFANEFIADRNPCHWTGFGEVPDDVSLEPMNFPIDDIYPGGNKPVLRMQLVSVTYPSLHRVCECSIIENDVDLWARRTLDSMTAGTVDNLVETILYTARMYEKSKCFERIYVHHSTLGKDLYDEVVIGSRYGMDSNAGDFFPASSISVTVLMWQSLIHVTKMVEYIVRRPFVTHLLSRFWPVLVACMSSVTIILCHTRAQNTTFLSIFFPNPVFWKRPSTSVRRVLKPLKSTFVAKNCREWAYR